MESARWQRLRDLFESASRLEPWEIESFLLRECGGDAELGRELRALLKKPSDEADPLLAAVRAAAREVSTAEPLPAAEIGQSIGKYTILGSLGAGGMGAVYAARDRELDRTVALKLITGVTRLGNPSLRRFRREARVLAALDHPNIVTAYSVEREGDYHFFTMELVEGRPLAEAIPEGGLALEEFFDIAIPLADALAAAHGHGIIHRDLKPANVMLGHDGSPKIMDFGLAKRQRDAHRVKGNGPAAPELTQAGVVIGTIPYMSPEQVESKTLDTRSDIFSFGVMLHEMITGRRPFQGDSAAGVMSSILKEDPAPVTHLRSGLPPRLARVIQRCLEKNPDKRYQHTATLARQLVELRTAAPRASRLASGSRRTAALLLRHRSSRIALPTAASVALALVAILLLPGPLRRPFAVPVGAPGITSLAVLPLVNQSGDPAQQYLADGMTEVLIAELSKISALKVISRTSVERFRHKKKPLREIAEELGGVDAIVEGAVTRDQDWIRITAQLIHAKSDVHLWAETFERRPTDVLVVQSEVARAVAREIAVTLTPPEEARLARAEKLGPGASEAYLRGLDAFSRMDLDRALAHFEQVVAAEPDFAPGHARIAAIHQVNGVLGRAEPREAAARCKEALRRTFEIDPELAAAHNIKGWLALKFDWDWALAEREFEHAIELMPGLASAHLGLAEHRITLGRFEEGLVLAERARELDPLSWLSRQTLILQLYHAGRFDEAIVLLAAEPGERIPWNSWLMVRIAQIRGDLASATWFDLTWRRQTGMPRFVLADLEAAFESGAPGVYWTALAEHLARDPQGLAMPQEVAAIYTWLGERDKALDWLERAYDQRIAALSLLGVDPVWTPLRRHRRFAALLQRMDLPQATG